MELFSRIPEWCAICLILSIVIFLMVFSVLIIFAIFSFRNELIHKRNLDILRLKLEYKFDSDGDDFKVLDKLIKTEFTKYEMSHIHDARYITDKMQTEIVKEISKKVLERLYKNRLLNDKLEFMYHPDIIKTEVVERVQLVVIEYTIDRNSNGPENNN